MKTILVDAASTFVIDTDEGFKVFEEMKNILDKFPNPKIIVTNADDEQFKKFGLDAMPYEVFTLKHNPEKTDPEYYKTLLEKYNLKAEDLIYFEHSADAVKSAESVGIKTMLWNDKIRPLEDLKKFLESNI